LVNTLANKPVCPSIPRRKRTGYDADSIGAGFLEEVAAPPLLSLVPLIPVVESQGITARQ